MGSLKGEREQIRESIRINLETMAVYTRNDNELDWASGQAFLGESLKDLAQATGNEIFLHEALDALRAASSIFTRDRGATAWALLQHTFGNVASILGDLIGDAARTREAVQAYRNELEVFTRERNSRKW